MRYVRVMTWYISMISLLLVLPIENCQGQEEPPLWQQEFCSSLHEMLAGRFIYLTRSAIVDSDLLSMFDSREAILSTLEYFVRGQRNLELYWLKSYNRAARAFMLALYYCTDKEITREMPDFRSHIERFNRKERQERSEELAFVLSYRVALARRIADILKQRDPANYASDYQPRFEPVGTSSHETPLPTWCEEAKGERFQEEKNALPAVEP